jgi:hypothetical protein
MTLGLGALLAIHTPELLVKTAKGIAGLDFMPRCSSLYLKTQRPWALMKSLRGKA